MRHTEEHQKALDEIWAEAGTVKDANPLRAWLLLEIWAELEDKFVSIEGAQMKVAAVKEIAAGGEPANLVVGARVNLTPFTDEGVVGPLID